MFFERQEVFDYAEPIDVADLARFEVYFGVRLGDDEHQTIPLIETLVFLGIEENNGIRGAVFQDFNSFSAGSFGHSDAFEAETPYRRVRYAQALDQLNWIFSFEKMLAILLRMSLRREKSGPSVFHLGTDGEPELGK